VRVRAPYSLPADKERLLEKVSRLEWISIFLILTIVGVMYMAMGSSQAMKTAWFEDILSLVPPFAILLSYRCRNWKPNERFPYGFRRAGDIAFLTSAVALSVLGLSLLYGAATSLLRAEHPTIGTTEIFGKSIWMGWLMIAALTYSVIPPAVLGWLKKPLAEQLHDKTLHVDAAMNKADWSTAVAGILGILGVGFGWWWSDAAAAAFISVEILRDGFATIGLAAADLMDERPTRLGSHQPHPVIGELLEFLEGLDWVDSAEVRLREEGHVFAGEAYVVPHCLDQLPERLDDASRQVKEKFWQLYDVVITAVPQLDDSGRPKRPS
jgi:cation diffusion facilitator family transporter